jgi:hypothetical protein
VTTKIALVLDITPWGFCKNWFFGEAFRRLYHSRKSQRARNNVSSNWQLLAKAINLHISEDGILHSHLSDNLKSYKWGIIYEMNK